MKFVKNWLTKRSVMEKWSIAYIDLNPFRLKIMSEKLMESGIDTKAYEDAIYVRDEQYHDAMEIIRLKA